jgi:hypothetical protein
VNWAAVGAIGEILGAIALLATLLYLSTQVKQSNNVSRFAASRDLVNQFNDLNRLVATDSTLRQVLMKTGELSADEREQLYNFAMMFCNVWRSAQVAYDSDQIEEALYAAGLKDVLIEIKRWPNFRGAVAQWLSNYPENAHHKIFRPVLSSSDSLDGGVCEVDESH